MASSPQLPYALQSENDSLNTFVYQDFSHIPDDKANDSKSTNHHLSSKSDRVQKLPTKLNAMLSKPEFSQIITWMPHGRSWIILDSKAFVREVIPLYFENCNYNSFVRLVNAWGFRRMKTGRDQNSYYHELFLRGLPHIHKHMRRLKKDEKKSPLCAGKEPDLFKISERHPLPDLNHMTNKHASSRHLSNSDASMSSLCIPRSKRFVPYFSPLQGELYSVPNVQNVQQDQLLSSHRALGYHAPNQHMRKLILNSKEYQEQNQKLTELYLLNQVIEARRSLLKTLLSD